MYRRCCRLLTMVAVNAAPAAAAVLLTTDGTNTTTAASHFLITPSSSTRVDMSSSDETRSTTINSNNGLLLYYHQSSFYSQKVVMAMHEKNLPYKSHIVNIMRGVQYEPWFLNINPRGEVPVLKDDVKTIPGSDMIIDYLEDNFSNGDTPRLIPTNEDARIRQKVVHFRNTIANVQANWITVGSIIHSELVDKPKFPFTKAVRAAIYEKERNAGIELRKLAEKRPDASEFLLEKAVEKERMNRIVLNRSEYLYMLGHLDNILTTVEQELASHGPDQEHWWLCSEHFSAADIELAILLERLYQLGYETRFWTNNKRPNIEKYYARVQQRDSFKHTIPSYFVNMKILLFSQSPVLIGVGVAAALAVFISGICIVRKIMAR